MELLTLDVGNTTVDACAFTDFGHRYLGRYRHDEVEKLKGVGEIVVAVSVKPSVNESLRRVFGKKLRLLSKEDIPLKVSYRTPRTLGTDRVLFAYGVKEFYSQDAVLVMVGTALVIDLLLEGEFKGGFVSAGPVLKLRALHEATEGIPRLELRQSGAIVGKSTEECVLGGILRESVSFIKSTAELWSEEFKKELPIYITGGDGYLFVELGTYDPLILHRAMRRIIIHD